jgi:hypothetical protein
MHIGSALSKVSTGLTSESVAQSTALCDYKLGTYNYLYIYLHIYKCIIYMNFHTYLYTNINWFNI